MMKSQIGVQKSSTKRVRAAGVKKTFQKKVKKKKKQKSSKAQ